MQGVQLDLRTNNFRVSSHEQRKLHEAIGHWIPGNDVSAVEKQRQGLLGELAKQLLSPLALQALSIACAEGKVDWVLVRHGR